MVMRAPGKHMNPKTGLRKLEAKRAVLRSLRSLSKMAEDAQSPDPEAVEAKMKKMNVQIYPPPSDQLPKFWRDKYEKDAHKYWDIFYKRNGDKFFKDRHYLDKEWGAYFGATDSIDTPADHLHHLNVLEVGCGAGNTIFPLLVTYPNIFVHACDFSPRAINLVMAHKDYNNARVHAFVCDVTSDDLTMVLPIESIDVAMLVFTLSAISPSKMPCVLQNLRKVLKPNAHVLVRDYAAGDLAQERLSGKMQKISDNFYARGDGTRAFYFTEAGLTDVFEKEGFVCDSITVHEKQVENRAKEIVMERRWIQGVFRRVNLSSASESVLEGDCN